jgi:hypothetical protein
MQPPETPQDGDFFVIETGALLLCCECGTKMRQQKRDSKSDAVSNKEKGTIPPHEVGTNQRYSASVPRMGGMSRLQLQSDAPAVSIRETEDGADLQFLHAVLCQVSLPRKPTRESMFTRSPGRVSITLQAGPLFDGIKMVHQPLPRNTRQGLCCSTLAQQP